MYVCVCVYIFMHACYVYIGIMYVCMYVCIHTHTHIYMHINIYINPTQTNFYRYFQW